MVNIIHFANTVTDTNELSHHLNDVVFAQDTGTFDLVTQQRTVELHAANRRKVIAIFGEEQVLKQIFCSFTRWRLARTHHTVDFYQCAQTIAGWINTQRFRNIRTVVEVVGEQRFDALVTRLAHLRQQIQRQLHVGSNDQLTGIFVDVIFTNDFTCDVLNRHFNMLNAIFFKLTNVARGNTAAFLNVNAAIRFNIKRSSFATQALWHQFHLQLVVANFIDNFVKEQVKNLFSGKLQRAQNDSGRQLATTVNTNKQVVFRVKLKVEP